MSATVTITQLEKAEFDLVAAIAKLPAAAKAMRAKAEDVLAKLRVRKRELLAGSPEVLRKTSSNRPPAEPHWIGLPSVEPEVTAMVKGARDRQSEERRLAKRASGPRRYAAPAHLRGRSVRLNSGGTVDVPETGFCSPAAAAVHPGYGPAADSASHYELIALGFRELPRDPDDAVGGEAAMTAMKAALRAPVLGDRGLIGFLNRRAGR